MRCVVVGAAHLEIRVPVGPGLAAGRLPPDLGEEIALAVGGRGITMARALAALGGDVYLVTRLGEDIAAAAIDAAAYHFGFNTVLCPRTAARTARAVVLHDEDGDLREFLDAADREPVQVDIDATAAALGSSVVLVADTSELAVQLLPVARAGGALVVADLDDLTNTIGPRAVPFLQQADVLTVSTGPDDVGEAEFARRILQRSNAEIVTVGLGSHGVLVAGGGLGDVVHVLPPAGTSVPSRPGLGAAFTAALAHHLAVGGVNAAEAVQRALVTAEDAMTGAPSEEWAGTQVVKPPVDDDEEQTVVDMGEHRSSERRHRPGPARRGPGPEATVIPVSGRGGPYSSESPEPIS